MAAKSAQTKSRKGAVPRKDSGASIQPALENPQRTTISETHLAQLQQARQQAEEQLAALRALQQIAHSLSSELNLERLLRKVLIAALDVMQGSAGSLLLHDPKSDSLRFEVIEGGGKDALEGRTMRSSEGIAGWVFTHGEPLIVNDVRQDERFFAGFDESSGFHTASLICVPLIITGKRIGVIEVLNKNSGEDFSESDLDVLNTLAVQSAVAIENARLYQNLWEERNRILAIEEEVRKELARDVHDGPAQLLSAMVMNIRFIQALLNDNTLDMAKQELVGLEELATRTLKQVRELLFNQRPVILETQGLFPAVDAYVKRLNESREMNVQLEVTCEQVTLPGKADRTVFSIIQEAVGNVKKHAPGATVQIRLERHDDQLDIKVIDNGPGFDVHRVQATYDQRGSLGLLNMSERAQQIGGILQIDSTIGKGTQVTLSVPIHTETRTLSPRA
jgi:signal transduction histidine kinase